MNINNIKSAFIIFSLLLIHLSNNCLGQVQSELPDPLEAGWKGESVCDVLEENESIRVFKCTFAPVVGHDRHFHAEHFGYTLAGGKFRITDTTGTREVNVPTGYDFYNERIDWHEVLNVGETTAVFLIIEPK
ncbi:MAG: hypothetical protein ABJH98_19925 [Reichenbachiella sp.]|uniref:hypothetical protein n=1 Tax=Reichenbachiella sp. TaxID=2184521 RepID=UPI0032974D1C